MTPMLKKMSPLQKTLAAAACVLALLVLVQLGLGLVWTMRDNSLFGRVHPRGLGAEELAPEAEENPMVRALWDKQLYYDNTAYAMEEYDSNLRRADAAASKARLEAYKALGEAGVLPENACRAVVQTAQPASDSVAVAAVFTRVNEMLLYQGTAVSTYVMVADGAADDFDLAAACNAYVQYLGLEGLADWQPATLFEVAGMHSAALYSSGAQMLAQIVVDTRTTEGDSISCVLSPLSRQAFALQNKADA